MKKYFPFAETKFLPPIMPEDHEFALTVAKKFSVPENELCHAVRDIRATLQDKELSDLANIDYAKEISKIDGISSNKQYEKLKKKFKIVARGIKDTDEKFINDIHKQSAFLKVAIYFWQAPLNLYEKYVAIGLFLVYFKLWPHGRPYQTESEFNNNPSTSAEKWEEYLYNIVKSRLKKHSSLFIR